MGLQIQPRALRMEGRKGGRKGDSEREGEREGRGETVPAGVPAIQPRLSEHSRVTTNYQSATSAPLQALPRCPQFRPDRTPAAPPQPEFRAAPGAEYPASFRGKPQCTASPLRTA